MLLIEKSNQTVDLFSFVPLKRIAAVAVFFISNISSTLTKLFPLVSGILMNPQIVHSILIEAKKKNTPWIPIIFFTCGYANIVRDAITATDESVIPDPEN